VKINITYEIVSGEVQCVTNIISQSIVALIAVVLCILNGGGLLLCIQAIEALASCFPLLG